MDIWAFISLICFVIQLILAYVVYQTNKIADTNKVFSILCLACAYIAFCEFMIRQSETIEQAYFWQKTSFLFPMLISLLLHFLLVYLNYRKLLKHKITYIFLYFPAIVFSCLLLFTNLLTAKPVKEYFGYLYFITPDNPLFFMIYNFWGFFTILILFIICIKAYFNTSIRIRKAQLKYILIGFGIPIILALLRIFLSGFKIKIPEIVILGMLWENLFIVYAIRRYRLFELSPEALINEILDIMPDALFLLDEKGTIVEINHSVPRISGYERSELIYQPFNTILMKEEVQTFNHKLEQMQEKNILQFETVYINKNAQSIYISLTISSVKDKYGRTIGYIIICHDITMQKQSEEQIKFLAYHDSLTGLFNRKALYEHLEREIIMSKRPQIIDAKTLLFIDLDDFKNINDALGHEKGDLLLKEIAERIKHCLRESDNVFRLGGDEFIVLLHAISQEIDAGLVAEKIIQIISQPFTINNYDYFPSASIGISIFPKDGNDVETLVKHADIAMYDAKKEKNRYCFFRKEMNSRSIKRTEILKDIHSALISNQFIVYYQAIVNKDFEIIGAEALIRWQHPQNGLIFPSDFISIAESSRIIKDIDELVLRNVCRDLKKIELSGFYNIIFFINFSGLHITEKNIAQSVEAIINESSVKPHQIIIEITETAIIRNPELVLDSITSLSKMGVNIALDDFGTGNSAINYMLCFPISYLKIERSFIQKIPENVKYSLVVEEIIRLANKLKLKLIAEGVEQHQQHNILKEWGCELMQGFLYSKPVPYEQFIELLTKERNIPNNLLKQPGKVTI